MGKIIDRVREREAKKLSRMELDWRLQWEIEKSNALIRQLEAEFPHLVANVPANQPLQPLDSQNG